MNAILKLVALFLLRTYQLTLSPLFYLMGVRCRHEPTCSSYAMEAFRQHPPLKAFWLTADRLGRCRPGGTHGYDPVPPAKGDLKSK
ncbi:MAG: membrane protein insertion efficiency factor YidD [Pseudomonadota bacterium]